MVIERERFWDFLHNVPPKFCVLENSTDLPPNNVLEFQSYQSFAGHFNKHLHINKIFSSANLFLDLDALKISYIVSISIWKYDLGDECAV